MRSLLILDGNNDDNMKRIILNQADKKTDDMIMVTGLGGGEYDKKPPFLVFDVYNLKVK